jgi:hypothetical protein
MNSTGNDDDDGFSTMEYELLSLTITEQVLSFTGADQPKSIIQVLLASVYQTYRYCYRGVYVGDDNASVETNKTTTSHFSVNLGSRV